MTHHRPSLAAIFKHLWWRFIGRPLRKTLTAFANANPRLGLFFRETASIPWVIVALILHTTTGKSFSQVETIFLHLPKTGGTSVKALLEESYGASLLKISSARDIAMSLLSNSQPKAIVLNHVLPEILTTTRVLSFSTFEGDFFTIVRDPTKRFESGFTYGSARAFWPKNWGRQEVLRRLARIGPKAGLTKAKGVFFLRPQVHFLAFRGVEYLRTLRLEEIRPEQLLFLNQVRTLPALNRGDSNLPGKAWEVAEGSLDQVFKLDYETLKYELLEGSKSKSL